MVGLGRHTLPLGTIPVRRVRSPAFLTFHSFSHYLYCSSSDGYVVTHLDYYSDCHVVYHRCLVVTMRSTVAPLPTLSPPSQVKTRLALHHLLLKGCVAELLVKLGTTGLRGKNESPSYCSNRQGTARGHEAAIFRSPDCLTFATISH